MQDGGVGYTDYEGNCEWNNHDINSSNDITNDKDDTTTTAAALGTTTATTASAINDDVNKDNYDKN